MLRSSTMNQLTIYRMTSQKQIFFQYFATFINIKVLTKGCSYSLWCLCKNQKKMFPWEFQLPLSLVKGQPYSTHIPTQRINLPPTSQKTETKSGKLQLLSSPPLIYLYLCIFLLCGSFHTYPILLGSSSSPFLTSRFQPYPIYTLTPFVLHFYVLFSSAFKET